MAYSGSTAATTLQNAPVALLHSAMPFYGAANYVLGSSLDTTKQFHGGLNIWRYTSSDASTLLQGVGYFTDGLALGMRYGDIMLHVAQTSQGTSPTINIGVLVTTNSTAGFNIATGAAIASS
jgi:hypothetical protein